MKRITAFVASARKKHTYNAVRRFLDSVESYGDVESEIVVVSGYDLKTCRGCKLCCDRGEELCPLKDDRDQLIDRMIESDGVIFASPTFSLWSTEAASCRSSRCPRSSNEPTSGFCRRTRGDSTSA